MRIESREKHGDFLDTLVEELENNGSIYNQEAVVDLIILIEIASKHSTSLTIAWMVNFLYKNPKALAELKVIFFSFCKVHSLI